MEIKVKKLYDGAIIPSHGSEKSAGYDLYAYIENGSVTIAPGQMVKIGTGLSMELPDNTFGAIFARSGMATKRGLRPSNCTGVVDADYRNEYIVALYNDSQEPQIVEHGERIAQLVLLPYIPMEFTEVQDLNETSRNGGFGSTGTK